MTDDITLGDQTGDDIPAAPGHTAGAHQHAKILDVDELLESARLVERTATICLRADLQADHDRILAELGKLITPSGEILDSDDERDSATESNATRARRLADELTEVQNTMRASQRSIRFRAMPSDDWQVFTRAHLPKKAGSDLTDFNRRLVTMCAIEPTLTVEQYNGMRKKLGDRQITEMINKAWEACTEGGLDVPKSPASLRNLAQQ